jgi:exosortase D (VPLPA-CTERM-specific)
MNLSIKNLWKPAVIAVALIFLYGNALAKLGLDWQSDENYSHGLLVPFVVGYIVWLEFDNLKKALQNPSIWLGFGGILSAIFLLLAGTLGAELFTQRISFIVMLAAIIVYFFGFRLLKLLVVPFGLLLLAIPIPQIIFNKIAFPLQIFASQMAIWGIRVFEVPSVRNGNVIEILPRGAIQSISLEVVEACSGIRSLMTLVTLALVLAYFTRKKSAEGAPFYRNFNFYQAVILIVSAVPIAILTNAARVTSTGILTYYYGKSMIEGFVHEFSGWLVYIVALVLLAIVNFAVKKFHQIPNFKFQISNSEDQSPKAKNQSPMFAPILATLLLASLFINWFATRGEAEISRQNLSLVSNNLGDWKQRGGDIKFSPQTESVLRASDYVMREYEKNGAIANLYIGYYASQRGGATYHSPQNCLPGAGWEMKQPQLVEITAKNGKSFTANKFFIENGTKREIMIYWYLGRGRANASEYTDKLFTIIDSVIKQRSDGAMIRILIPAGNDEIFAAQSALDLASQTADNLSAFVPE